MNRSDPRDPRNNVPSSDPPLVAPLRSLKPREPQLDWSAIRAASAAGTVTAKPKDRHADWMIRVRDWTYGAIAGGLMMLIVSQWGTPAVTSDDRSGAKVAAPAPESPSNASEDGEMSPAGAMVASSRGGSVPTAAALPLLAADLQGPLTAGSHLPAEQYRTHRSPDREPFPSGGTPGTVPRPSSGPAPPVTRDWLLHDLLRT